MTAIHLLLDAQATIAESLLWEPDQALLYWVDIKAPALFSLNPASGAQRSWFLPSDVGAYALEPGSRSAIVALRTGLHRLSMADGALELLAPAPFDTNLFRFNEGAVDAHGRFWIGVMFDPLPGFEDEPKRPFDLMSWTREGGLMLHRDASTLHNGMAWSADGRHFFLCHSFQRVIHRFDTPGADLALGKPTRFAETPPGHGIPDGAAVDVHGNYWCANHGGSRLLRYAPDGTLLHEQSLPVSQPTMVAFGGPGLRTLFISSARDKLTEARLAAEPHAGGLFHMDPGVAGVPRHHQVAG